MTLGVLLFFAFAAWAASIAAGFRLPRTWLALTATGAALGLAAALRTLAGGPAWEWRSEFPLGGEALHLRLDGVSALFLTLVCVIGGAGAVYSREYWSDHHHPASAPRGRAWWSALLASMGLVLTASNGLHFLLAWELFAICGYFLVTLDRERAGVRAAGWLYLAASHAGTLCLFAFFAALAALSGSWDLGPMRDRADLTPLFWLALFGFGVKAGFFPLHVWLPSAHANAPSHVSAIMSGVAIKMGLYGIVRFSGWLPVPSAAGWVVTGFGATSALLGIAFAFAQNDFKRLLAYCSVENIGVILTGVGVAMLAGARGDAPWGRLVLAGALLHVWNHGVFKSLLFLGAGSALHATGTREMTRLGGLAKTMPWTAGLFALGAIAAAGLPPLNGFASEWLVYLGLFDTVTNRAAPARIALPAVIMLAIAGALAMASFVKAGAMIFLGAPRTQPAARAVECGPWMRGPMLGLATLCAAMGLAPLLFWPAISRVAESWRPAWTPAEAPAPLVALSAAQATLAFLVVAAAAFLWRKARGASARRGMTWDCGYAAPSARMQYSSASFAGIASGWFSWILRPERKTRRPRGLFPADAIRLERFPETVLEKIVGPAGAAIKLVAVSARRLQHGRLQFYILYVVAGLVGLGALVFMGGAL
jgi:hydrogenase-4 component B